jgi:hypothetical protein
MHKRLGAGVLLALALPPAPSVAADSADLPACPRTATCEAGKPRWSPRGKVTWTIDYSADPARNVATASPEIYVLPLTTVEKTRDLQCHENKKLVCYTNCGAYEAGHWNEDLLDPVRSKMLGNTLEGYAQERWLNIKELGIMRGLITDKFAKAAKIGCDALVCDNVEAWITGTDGKDGQTIALFRQKGIEAVKELAEQTVTARTGFDITYDDQLRYNQMLAAEAHRQCLSIGIINDVFQLSELASDFDFALNEQCHHCGWCDLYRPLVDAGKSVLHLEFADNEDFCKPGSAPIENICRDTAHQGLTTFSTIKRAASSKLHLPDEPQKCE